MELWSDRELQLEAEHEAVSELPAPTPHWMNSETVAHGSDARRPSTRCIPDSRHEA